MKRFIFLLGFIAFLFSSCSQLNDSRTDIKIQLPSARDVGGTAGAQTYDAEVSLIIDDAVQTQTGKISTLSENTFTFNGIEVGASAVALCRIILDNIVIWEGKSEKVTITEGINIPIEMKSTVFTQEKFRTLMPDYKTNSDTQFAIPEGYTKLVGIDIATGRDSIFSGWAPLTSPVGSYLSIKIPKSVVYIDAAAFCGITNNNLILEFEDDSGWVYTGKIKRYDDVKQDFVEDDVKNHYFHTGIAAFGYLKEGKGYIQKMDFLDLDFPINEKSLQVSVTDDKGDVVYISEIVSKGTILNFSVPGDNTGSDGSKPIVPKTCKWYINGELKSEKATFTWDTTEVPSGAYEVMCIVNDKFSQNLTIKIGTR